MIEVINNVDLNEPGARFKKEKEKILRHLKIDIDLEEAKEELALGKISEGQSYDLIQVKENFATAIESQNINE
jgi:hypothetical protein